MNMQFLAIITNSCTCGFMFERLILFIIFRGKVEGKCSIESQKRTQRCVGPQANVLNYVSSLMSKVKLPQIGM